MVSLASNLSAQEVETEGYAVEGQPERESKALPKKYFKIRSKSVANAAGILLFWSVGKKKAEGEGCIAQPYKG